MNAKVFFCAICWQEFDEPKEHDAPSAFKGERLNGHCNGDIRRAEPSAATKRKAEKGEPLDLTQGEPIILA